MRSFPVGDFGDSRARTIQIEGGERGLRDPSAEYARYRFTDLGRDENPGERR